MTSINYLPIIISAVIAFGISALWYSPFLFGREWMNLVQLSSDKAKIGGGNVIWSYIIHLVAILVSLCILAFALASMGIQGALDGALVGALAWLGFVAPTSAFELIWKKTHFKLVLIDTANMLLTLVIGGAIISAW
jgi:hypothetical protein